MTTAVKESSAEKAALEWFEGLGYAVRYGPDIAPGGLRAERQSYGEAVLPLRLKDAVHALNPSIPDIALEDAIHKVMVPSAPSLAANNQAFHRMLVDGVPVEYPRDGRIVGDRVRLLDFGHPEQNDWLVVNQFTMVEGRSERRPDVVVFVNGLPLAVIELKNPADEQATIWTAFKQLQTYKKEIPSFFTYNEVLVVSDGLQALVGSLTAGSEWFKTWRTIDGTQLAPGSLPQLQVVIQGLFEQHRFLDLIRYFITFTEDRSGISKILPGYHQYHAVNKAVAATIRAISPQGDRRCGVVWHTQGSGKSLTMAFYAGKIIQHPAMANPTLVVITDRNDLDDQLYQKFCQSQDLLRQTPVQAQSHDHLRSLLHVAAGRVIFTTIQKFLPDGKDAEHPLLSDRRNVVVIADEAHRSQYDFIDGLARHLRDALPNASFIGFTGTPLELDDRSTPRVFGDYISIYDIQQAVDDGATVPIYYESRLAKLELDEAERPRIDPDFEEVTEGEEASVREKLKTKWAQLEALVGSEKRIALVARDLVDHFEKRLQAMDGKAMVVCMSRHICADLYNAIIKLRPEWHDPEDHKGAIKVVITGSASDRAELQPHIRGKVALRMLAQRFKDPNDPLKIVIVRDMWLTGFDVPCLHTMYIDKPMRGHNLMQAIARVNRVFRDKRGGLVVDYIGIADQLKQALNTYIRSGGRGKAVLDQEAAVAKMLEYLEVCQGLFHGFDYRPYLAPQSEGERLSGLKAAVDFILSIPGDSEKGIKDGKERLVAAVTGLSEAYALAVPHEKALQVRAEVAFFQSVKASLVKGLRQTARPQEELDQAVRQIVSRAVASDKVVDILALAGLDRPDISVLSDEFLAEVQNLPQRNLAVEALKRLLRGEIHNHARKNLVQGRSFAEMLEKTLQAYHNRSVETVQIIRQLVDLAKVVRDANARGQQLGMTDEELAFYDALATNGSAVKVLGDRTLRQMAQELVQMVRRNTTVDWTIRESAQARLRALVKRLLRRYHYPPDQQEEAVKTVLQQATLLADDGIRDQVG